MMESLSHGSVFRIMKRPFKTIALGMLLAFPCNAQDAAFPKMPSDSEHQMPGLEKIGVTSLRPDHLTLEDYLKKTGYLTNDAEYVLYRTGPESPGNRLQSIFALRFNDISNCGSIGCTQIIVTEDNDGQFTLYDEFVGGDLTMLPTHTNGVRDLATSTENGPRVGRFNGTKYTWSRIKKNEVAEPKPVDAFPVEISGECIEDRAWHGYRISPTEAAAGFGYCRTNQHGNLLLFSCEAGDRQVRTTMNMTTRELDDSENALIRLSVDGKSFTLDATAYYDVMSGFVLPEIEPVPHDYALFDALETAQTSITLFINGRQKTIHSNGIAAAFKLMRETCS